MQDGSNRYEDIFYCLAFRLGEQAFLRGEKIRNGRRETIKWEERGGECKKKKKFHKSNRPISIYWNIRLGIDAGE